MGWLHSWVKKASAHTRCSVGVDLGISECNRAREDVDTTSLRATAQSSKMRVPHRGNGKVACGGVLLTMDAVLP